MKKNLYIPIVWLVRIMLFKSSQLRRFRSLSPGYRLVIIYYKKALSKKLILWRRLSGISGEHLGFNVNFITFLCSLFFDVLSSIWKTKRVGLFCINFRGSNVLRDSFLKILIFEWHFVKILTLGQSSEKSSLI